MLAGVNAIRFTSGILITAEPMLGPGLSIAIDNRL